MSHYLILKDIWYQDLNKIYLLSRYYLMTFYYLKNIFFNIIFNFFQILKYGLKTRIYNHIRCLQGI